MLVSIISVFADDVVVVVVNFVWDCSCDVGRVYVVANETALLLL